MSTGLQAKTILTIASGGYSGEKTGSSGGYSRFTDVDLNGSLTASYYFTDSDSGNNNNSSRVTATIKSSWSATVNSGDNSISVTLVETLLSVTRGNVTGNPASSYRVRNIEVWDSPGKNDLIWSVSNNNIAAAATLFSGSKTIDTKTFTLSAGGGTNYDDEVYVLGYVPGYWNGALPSVYCDAMYMGITLKNNLPADYRPGQRRVSGTWRSHDRSAGACQRRVSGSWVELRTLNGGVGTNNPPKRKTSGAWYNQKELGAD